MNLPAVGFSLLSFAIALGVLIFVHELGHFLVAKRLGVRVLRFSFGFGSVLASWKKGETEYALSALPLGGYVKMLGEDEADAEGIDDARSFLRQPLWRRTAIVSAGPVMNFVFAFVVYALLFVAVGAEQPSNQPRIGGVAPGMPAERAGLQAGDRVLAVNDKPITTWEELSKTILASGGAPQHLTVERDGARLGVDITPRLEPSHSIYGEREGDVYRIGIEASRDWTRVGPGQGIVMAAEQTGFVSWMVVKELGLMLAGRLPMRDLGGPIAIARAAGQQARAGARYFISTLAFLSINLGVLNLLPIPALDGGHLAFFTVEGLMRRPLRRRHREIAQQLGMLLLITLMMFVFYNDIHRLVQG